MPLDNAQFISELSIADPPGTDPLNQGDDQIRTTKRATQQSFPNIDAPVTLSAAQLEQAAIKNEANIFTQINTFNTTTLFNGHLRAADGVAATPVYSFQNETGMGMYRQGAGQLGFAVSGVERMRLSSTAMSVFQQTRAASGTDAAPGYAFSTNPDTGILVGTGGALNFSVAAQRRLQITAAGSRFGFRQDGATGGVSLSLESDVGLIAWSIDYEGTAGFQPGQLSFSRFNRTTGVFIDIPLYIAADGRVHSLLPILTP